MTEREKMIEIVLDTEITGIKLRNITGGISTANAIADALIAAGYGDVTEWKERAEKEKAEKNKWKCTANDWKQRFESREKQLGELRTTSCDAVMRKNKVISEQKAEIVRLTTECDEYKRCVEVAERALLTACVNLIKDEDNVNMELLARVVYTMFLRKAEKELAGEDKR